MAACESRNILPWILAITMAALLLFVLRAFDAMNPTTREGGSLMSRPTEKVDINKDSQNPNSNGLKGSKNTDSDINDVDWIRLFSKIPYAVTHCKDIAKNRSLAPDFESDFNEYVAEVRKQGPTMGHMGLPEYRELYIIFQDIVKAPFIKTVCETGFNAGHSSFGWLRSNPKVQVYSFDIGTNQYSRPMAKHIQEKFPGRHHITWGDSRETLPKFREEHPEFRCDLILIDGGHYYDVVRSDFANFKLMANPVHIVIMDNYPDKRFMWMGDMWERSKRTSQLFEFFHCHYWDAGDAEGTSFGRYAI